MLGLPSLSLLDMMRIVAKKPADPPEALGR
jgi:hypothetical protein